MEKIRKPKRKEKFEDELNDMGFELDEDSDIPIFEKKVKEKKLKRI